ncbi:MAG TPA: keywimysin-related RiPP [Actinomycetes bacterium]|nr:keywimysin-related RiPP [Actinomycetes bacterium]
MRDNERALDERETDERESYERPTLTPAGSFTSMTGLNGQGPKDTLTKHQLL